MPQAFEQRPQLQMARGQLKLYCAKLNGAELKECPCVP